MGKEKVKGGAQRLKLNTQWLKKHESVLLTFHIALSHQIRLKAESTGVGVGWGGSREKNVIGKGLATFQLANILHSIKSARESNPHYMRVCWDSANTHPIPVPPATPHTLKSSIIEIA